MIERSLFVVLALGAGVWAQAEPHQTPASGEVCAHFGPQTPRDIDLHAGENPVRFDMAPPFGEMSLCNLHLHESAEHKARDFAIYAGDGHEGFGSGYQCAISKQLSRAELEPPPEPVCAGAHGELRPGDTIEVHWVYSTCDVEPGPTLGACLSSACSNPQLRVEAQVFTLVNDPDALDFNELKSAAQLPRDTGAPVQFLGSTTGPSFSDQVCSPYQVTWSVRPACAKLNIASLGAWCRNNVYKEDHAHGVRKLVTDPRLLSEIR